MHRRPKRLTQTTGQYLAWLCLFLTLWPAFGVAATSPIPGSVPVVTNVAGAVSVRGGDGVSRDVISSRIIHSGDTLITGVDSLAVVSLADVGSVRLGPASTASASTAAARLTVRLSAGSACAQSLSRGVTIAAGSLAFTADDDSAIFSLVTKSGETTIAVYQGQISATLGGKSASTNGTVLKAGDAAVSSHNGTPVLVPIQTVQQDFAALKCPDDAVIARAMPSAEPSPQAGGGHGGGGGGFLGILLGLGALAALAGGHGAGGGGGGSTPAASPTPSSGQLNVNPQSLSFLVAGAPQQFTASESNYSGKINASSGNALVATVAPASGTGSPVTFTVTPVGPGTTNITVTDNHGGSKNVSITVTPPGTLSVAPSSLTFLVGGAPQTFTASETSYTGPLHAVSNDTGVATVAPSSGSGPGPVTFTVTPVGPGSTTITVTDNHGGSKDVSITVTPPGTLSVAPGSLTFLVGGAPQSFTASESSYTGPISASSEDTSTATVSGSGNGPGPVTFTVTPHSAGTTKIDVSDDHGGLQKVSITVTPPGALSVNPGTLSFLHNGASQQFTARESSYTGPLNAASNDTSIATVAPSSGTGPGPVTFTVTPGVAGNTNIVVTDNHGGSQSVGITVVGPISTNPTSLTFLGTTTSQNFTATDPFYTGTISASIDHLSVATVAPVGSTTGPGPVTFKVTPVAAGNATVTVSDTLGGSKTLAVSVSTGALTINPNILTFTVGGPTQTFTGSEADYTGPISAASSNTAKATVSPASGPGPGPVTFTVAAVSAGNPTIAVTDNHGGGPLFVDVTITGPLTPTPGSLTFDGTTSAQTINVNDPNYSGSISASSTNLSVATVTSPGVGPNATFSVTPVNMGTATINFMDANLGTTSVGVTVNPGPLSVSTSSISITGVGATQTFNASEVLYTGPIHANSGDTTVATVSPATAAGPTPAPFTVTSVGPGATTVTVTDNHGGSKPISIDVSEIPTVAPGTLSFTDVGAANAQSVSVSEPGYHGAFSIASNTCASLATVGPASGPGPSATVPVVPLNTTTSGGSCHFSVQDSFGSASSLVSVTVGPFGAVVPSQTAFSFSDVGAGNAKTFTVAESGYTGNFTIDASACAGIASVSPSSGDASTTFTVTAIAGSSTPCHPSVNDDHTQTASLSVTVGPFGSITPNPTSLTFSDVGSGFNQSFTISESGYTGNFTVDASACASKASVSPLTGNSSTTFTVTPLASTPSPCNLSVTDDHSSPAATLSVTVGPFGAVVPNPTSLTFTDVGAGSNQTFTVSESGYTGNFSIDASACSGFATVNPLSGSNATTFTVTPTAGTSSPCNLNIADDHSGSATLSVTVGPFGPVVPGATRINLTIGGSSGTFMVSESGYTGLFTLDASTCSSKSIATESPGSGTSGTTFTITPGSAAGNCKIIVSDDHGGSQNVIVSVTAGTLTVSPITLSFTGTGQPSQTFTASDPGATTFNATSSDVTIATVLPSTQAGPGPVTFTVSTSTNTGQASITVTDDIGGTAVVSVGVGVSPLRTKHRPIRLHRPMPHNPPGRVPKPIRNPIGPVTPRRPVVEGNSPSTRPSLPSPGLPPVAAPLNVSVTSLTLAALAPPQAVTISEFGYSRFFTVSTSDAAVATVNSAAVAGPTATILIAARGPGVALIRIADDHGAVRTIAITVRAAPQRLPRLLGKPEPQ